MRPAVASTYAAINHAAARKLVFSRQLRPMSFQQAPPVAGRDADPSACAASAYLGLLEPLLELDQDECVQAADAPDRHVRRFPQRKLLSNDLRVPLTLLQTTACSPLATNALAGNTDGTILAQTYKDLPSVGRSRSRPLLRRAPALQDAGRRRGYTAFPRVISLVVDGALPPQQQRRPLIPEPAVDARWRRSVLHRADAVARAA